MEFLIDEKAAGSRLDNAVKIMLETFGFPTSRSNVQKLIAEGHIKVNGAVHCQKNYKTAAGDRLNFDDSALNRGNSDIRPVAENLPLDIVYEDEYFLICNKARGMAVYPHKIGISGTLVNALLYHVERLSDFAGEERPGIVHRLDADTSGLIIIAKDNETHAGLSYALANKQIDRVYRAVVFGKPDLRIGEEKLVSAPIARHPSDRTKRTVLYDAAASREAFTRLKLIGDYGGYSYIECALVTGRTHQIRVHMAHLNHPVVGDRLYSSGFNYPLSQSGQRVDEKVKGLLLHSYRLVFEHPHTGEMIDIHEEEPEDFKAILDLLRR